VKLPCLPRKTPFVGHSLAAEIQNYRAKVKIVTNLTDIKTICFGNAAFLCHSFNFAPMSLTLNNSNKNKDIKHREKTQGN